MVHAFNFDNGKVSHMNRWARTARFDIEKRLGGSYFSGMNPLETDPRLLDFVLKDIEGVANTSIICHGGRMLLLEEGHRPFSMDPVTLESYGAWDFYGKLDTPMTAHPKVDPVTGEMIFFAYMTTGPFTEGLSLYKVDRDGFMTESHHFNAPYSSMVHDFVVTENYIIFPILPLTGDLERAMSGGPPFAWEPERTAYVGVMPRTGTPEEIQWIEADPCYVFHYMNGSDIDGVITFECSLFDKPPLFPTVDGQSTGIIHPRMNRWVIDMNVENPRVTQNYISDTCSEFPVIDPRYAMRDYNHGWYTSTDRTLAAKIPDSDWVYNTIEHFNVKTGAVDRYSFSNGYVAEPMFVPKSDTAAEGEGYVLDVVYNQDTNMSDMCVFDAQNISAGPMGKAKVSHRVPVSFHGTWKGA